MGFNTYDYNWMILINQKPDVYAFRLEETDNGTQVQAIDNYTGEIVHIFALKAECFLWQLLDFYGFEVTDY